MRLIDADPLIDECKECASIEWNKKVSVFWADAEDDFRQRLEDAPTVDAVPTDFHDKCMNAEFHKRIKMEKIARMLCEGYLDMPSGCDGCPLVDTMIEDDEGNGVCDLYRR